MPLTWTDVMVLKRNAQELEKAFDTMNFYRAEVHWVTTVWG